MSTPNIARLPLEIKFIDACFRRHVCPRCGTDCPRHSVAVRHAMDIGLDRPVLLQIKVGVYRCPRCRKHRFFRTPLDFLGPYDFYVQRCRQKLTESIREDQMPIGLAARRMDRDFNIGIAISTAWEWLRGSQPDAQEIAEYEHLVAASFSGVICVDEVYDKGYGILCATDPLNGRTLAYELCEGINQERVIAFFGRLKAMGINAEVVVSDGSSLYPKAIKAVWNACLHQLCRFHWTKDIVKEVNKGVRDYRETIPKPEKRTKRGRPGKDEAAAQAAAGTAQSARDELRKGRLLLVTRRENLNEDQTTRLDLLLANHEPLVVVRDFMDGFYAIFKGKPRPKDAAWRRLRLLKNADYIASPFLAQAVEILKDDVKFAKVALYLNYKNLNSTSNDVERDNRGFRKGQKSHYRFRSPESLQVYLNCRLLRSGAPSTAIRLERRFGNPTWTKKEAA